MAGLPTLPMPTWFVGCGNMGGAILKGWHAAAIDLAPVTVIRPSGGSIEGVRVVRRPRPGRAAAEVAGAGIQAAAARRDRA